MGKSLLPELWFTPQYTVLLVQNAVRKPSLKVFFFFVRCKRLW